MSRLFFFIWIEVEQLLDKTSTECKKKLKNIFSVHGILKIVTDYMFFNSSECKQFSKERNFTFTITLNYSKNYVQSEKAVGIVKKVHIISFL